MVEKDPMGDPAFPKQNHEQSVSSATIRQWYACVALQGLLANVTMKEEHPAYTASLAFQYAEAMLEAERMQDKERGASGRV